MTMILRFLGISLFVTCSLAYGQLDVQATDDVLTYDEYMAFVKQHHPVIGQADLTLSAAEAKLLRARGAFDPKVEADYNRKKFKNIEYYDKLNAAFKIPTWFGIELKGEFKENTGVFLNPENNLPIDGLYSAGISVPLARDLLINERMAVLKQSKLYVQQTEAQRKLLVNDLLYQATSAYLEWVSAKREQEIFEAAQENAEERFLGVVRTVEQGQEAAIDSIEAKIGLQQRLLGLELANLKYLKAKLNVSNYLWLEGIPLEIEETVGPRLPNKIGSVNAMFTIESDSLDLDNHPRLIYYDRQIDGLRVDVSLKKNNLLPRVDLQYNFLSPEYDELNSFNTANYRAGLNFSLPIFLRKERGDLKLSKTILQDSRFERLNQETILKNKVEAVRNEITSYTIQNQIVAEMVANYQRLLDGEIRKFNLGESSLFLINTREQKLIEAQVKEIETIIKELDAVARLFNVLAVEYVNL